MCSNPIVIEYCKFVSFAFGINKDVIVFSKAWIFVILNNLIYIVLVGLDMIMIGKFAQWQGALGPFSVDWFGYIEVFVTNRRLMITIGDALSGTVKIKTCKVTKHSTIKKQGNQKSSLFDFYDSIQKDLH